MFERVDVFKHSPSLWRQQVNAARCIVVVGLTIASVGDNLPAIIDPHRRHQQDVSLGGDQIVEIAHSTMARRNEGMRDTCTRGRGPDYLPGIIDAERHTESFPAEK